MNKITEPPDKRRLLNRVAYHCKKAWRWCLRKESDTSLRDAIEELIEEDLEGESSIGTDERLLLSNVLSLKDLTAKDVMIPYANIIAASISATQDEIVATLINSGVSQIPIYSGTVDNVIGGLYLKDVVPLVNGHIRTGLKSILKEVPFVAPTMRTLDLLLQMRETGVRMAVVVDEYGGVEGLVTFSSLIEEIIGDIQYAEDHGDNNPLEISNGCIVLNASTVLDELNESLEQICGQQIDWLKGHEDEDVDTIGGVITLLAGRVPMRGELIAHSAGVEFEILDADPRRVKKIAIRNLITPPSVGVPQQASAG
ncbi:MAG: hemolysin family protein [Holosporales bacterium]|jgi:CBS domain containing-hemolysin-like protein|nr:hemolysin family protein [Holosporales bacterium]